MGLFFAVFELNGSWYLCLGTLLVYWFIRGDILAASP